MTTTRPTLAIVANAPSPYRVQQHMRIVREMGDQIQLWSVFLHERNWQSWTAPLPEEINPVVFGLGEHSRQNQKSLRGWWREWRKMRHVINWLKEHRVDAVITTGYQEVGLTRLIAWCHRRGVPNFMFGDSNIRGDRPRGWRRVLKPHYVRWIVSKVTGLMPCGAYGQQYFERYGGGDKPTFFMPHEPDYPRIFAVTEEQKRAVREKFGLRNDRRYFVYSGRLVAVKRVDTLIDAFTQIADQRPDWDLLIIGGGELEKSLRDRVPDKLSRRVVWTGFIDSVDELSALYASGDVFVLPSSYEPWGVVVCEAAAAGMPIAASQAVGAAGELCRPGVNGDLFAPGDAEELARILLHITETDERLQEYSRGSLKVLDDWRRRGDPVQGVRLALAHVGLLDAPPPVTPKPPTPVERSPSLARSGAASSTASR